MINFFLLCIFYVGLGHSEVIYDSPSGETVINGVGSTVINNGIGGSYTSITAIPGNAITIENNIICCGHKFVCPINTFTCTITQCSKSNDTVIETKRSCSDIAGTVGETNVTETENPYPGLPVNAFAMASLNGSIWSCSDCKVKNVAQANQMIAEGLQEGAEIASKVVSKVGKVVSRVGSQVSADMSQLRSSLSEGLSSLRSGLSNLGSEITNGVNQFLSNF